MSTSCKFLIILFIVIPGITVEAQSLTNKMKLEKRAFNNSVSAVFVFGDSTVDSGNNNYVKTAAKCDFPPYGRDFVNHIPTGRFSDGRLVTDYIVSHMGIKDLVPPYLDPSLSMEELTTGVSFASGGTGFDPLTAQLTGVISLEKQLEYFKEYKRRVESAIGKEKTDLLISKSIFFISAGTNDFIISYFGIRRQTCKVSIYQHFLLQHVHQFILGLMKEGARVINVAGVPPLGCLPVVITLNSGNALQPRQCVESYSAIGRDYNSLLQHLLKTTQIDGTKLLYLDIYNPLNDMMQNPHKYGFSEVYTGCCGSGLVEAAILCNPKSIVCNNPSQYMFWDSVHPGQVTYYTLFQALRPTIDFGIKQ